MPLELDRDQILAVYRKIFVDCDAAARAERQVFALPVILHYEERNLVAIDSRTRRRQAHRQPRDLAGHRHVPF